MNYLSVFNSISSGNKYNRWYNSLIERAINRIPPNEGEYHHILPKSFNMGGFSDKLNIVKLTGREHFIAHKLITKSLVDPLLIRKAHFAVFQMSNRLRFASSRDVETARINVSQAMSELWKTSEYRELQAEKAKTKYKTEGYKELRISLGKIQMTDSVQRENAIKTLAEAHKFIDHSSSTWLDRSLHSSVSKQKARVANKSSDNRRRCSERELAKSDEQRSTLAKTGQSALRSKFNSDEEFREYLSQRIKGRKKIINLSTFEVKIVNIKDIPDGWVIYTTLTAEDKSKLKVKDTND